MNESLLTIETLAPGEIEKILTLASRIKEKASLTDNVLRGKTIGMIFEKPSTRTWVSFEVGIAQMGGHVVYLGPQDIKLNVREETKDVARVLGSYLDGLVMRTFKHKTIEEFAKYFKKPIINGLSDRAHPCQAFADFLTLKEEFKQFRNLTLAYVGDGNNVLNSLLFLGAKTGVNVHFACPKSCQPKADILKKAREIAAVKGTRISGFTKPEVALKGADAVYTDVWVSMGEEKKAAAKKRALKSFQVNSDLMKHANKNAIVMHCLPAHKGEEITEEVMESYASRIFDQAENRLHAQKAILAYLFRNR